MVSAAKMAEAQPVRALIVGYPGAGKTGACACLASAGYQLRVLAFDKVGNMSPLLQYTDQDKLGNIDICLLEDKLRSGQKFIETAGLPEAFSGALKMMDHWTYKDEDGNEVDLGRSKDWGPETVVVLDSLTAMGEAAFRRAQAMLNKTPLNTTQQVWGLAMRDQEAFLEKLTSNANKFHVVVLSHLKMIGPKDIMPNDDDTTKELKGRVADIVPTRLFPSALGQSLPPKVGMHFPTVLLAEQEHKGPVVRRVLRTVSRPELDLKVPAKGLPKELDISDGLLQVFKAISKRSEA